MKKIHFDNYEKNNYWNSLIIFAIIFILVGIFEPFQIENPTIYKYISSFGFLLQALFFSKLFWFKNFVQWNNLGAFIRIDSFFGKSLNFKKIKTTELNEKKLKIIKNNGKIVIFNLNEIMESDIQKLKEIIMKNTIANTVQN